MAFRTGKYGLGRGYIIALSRWRSRLALIAGLITVFCSLYAVAGGIVIFVRQGQEISGLFHYFTINSNCLTAFSASMILPFAVEGIRKKAFSYPRWVAMFHYSGMVCTTLTLVFVLAFISWTDPELAFGGYNIYLHIICPILVLVSFFLVESDFRFTAKDSLTAMIPAVVYMLIYGWEVFLVGAENGGWEDLYQIADHIPVFLAAPAAFLLVAAISFLLRRFYNSLALRRRRKLESCLWPPDVHPVEINIEMFGLGRYMGKHADTEFVELPLELIRLIAGRYSLETEDLIRPYIKGFLDSLKEKQAG